MPERSVAGRSIVTRRAIVDIVRTAVQSSYGVTGFSDPSLGRRLLRWVGLDRPGIKLSTEGGIALDLYLNVAFGVPVAEVARQVDSAVRYSLRRIIGVEVAALAIHIDGLRFQQETAAPEPDPKVASAASVDLEVPGRAPRTRRAASSSRSVASNGAAGETAPRKRKAK
jgi:uncharacterized alkaline shock family protein YloU